MEDLSPLLRFFLIFEMSQVRNLVLLDILLPLRRFTDCVLVLSFGPLAVELCFACMLKCYMTGPEPFGFNS
jgi:hypothetical protein